MCQQLIPGLDHRLMDDLLVAQIGMMKKNPYGLLTAALMIWKTKVNAPANPPTGTHKLMAVGTLTLGFGHSSAILDIIPIALNV